MIERENIFRMSKDYTGLGTHCSLEATLASPRVHRSARSTRTIKLILREHNPCVICQRWPAQVSQNSHMFSFWDLAIDPLNPYSPLGHLNIEYQYIKCTNSFIQESINVSWCTKYVDTLFWLLFLGLLLLKEKSGKRQFKTWGRMFPIFQLVPAAL